MKICDKVQCVGCGMCTNICPENAITMISDSLGFLQPNIDEDKCINCNLCAQTCPSNNIILKGRENPTVYAAWNADKTIRKASTSGGVFSLLAHEILLRDGIVCGVKWDGDFKACHCIVDNIKDLHLLYGSKYVQSFTGDIYSRVKEELEKDRYVLFSGTPCQVAALNSFLKGNLFEKLYTVDVVCHGVPSYELFQKHLNEISNNCINNIKNVRLRYKSPCWSFGSVKVDFKDEKTYIKPTVEDAFFNLFNFNYSLRESCHNCKYTSINRNSDATLCDFWGYSPKGFKMVDFDKGVSGILLNTEKGDMLFNKIKKYIVFEESTIQIIKNGNQCLEKPFAVPKNVENFWTDYKNGMTVDELNKKYIKEPYSIPNHLWLRRIKRQYKWIFGR